MLNITVIFLLLVHLGSSTVLCVITLVDFDFDKIERQNNIDFDLEEIKELSENVDEKIQHLDASSWLNFSLFNNNIYHLIDFQALNYLEIISPPPEL